MITLRYAILDNNNIVEHLIDIEELEKNSYFTSEQIIQKFFPDKKIIQQSEKTGEAKMGFYYYNNIFIQPRPYESWNWNGNEWIAPVKYPNNGKPNFWNEDDINWIPYTKEELNE